MNRYKITVLAGLAFLSLSCEENEDKGTVWDDPNFIRMTAETEPVSVPGQENMRVSWTDGDAFAVFDDKGRSVELATNLASSNIFYSYSWHEGGAPRYMVSPWSDDVTCTADGLVGVTIPSLQKVSRPSVFDNFVGVGRVTGNKTSYETYPVYNVTGFMAVSLNSPDAVSIRLESAAGETMAARVNVDISRLEAQEADWLTIAGGEQTSVTLCPTDGKDVLDRGRYYMALLPGTYTKGFIATVTYKSGGQVTNVLMPDGVTVSRSGLSAYGEEPVDDALPGEIELTLDFSTRWPFAESVVAVGSQSSEGDTYTYEYEYEAAGVLETLGCDFLLIGRSAYEHKDGCLYPGSSAFGRISIPGIQGRYLKSVNVDVTDEDEKKFEFKNSSRLTIDVGKLSASKDLPMLLSFPTANGVDTEKGATYHLSFASGDTHVRKITIRYARK